MFLMVQKSAADRTEMVEMEEAGDGRTGESETVDPLFFVETET